MLVKSKRKRKLYDEVIAEAIHDYYLHRDSSSTSSLEIINIIKREVTTMKECINCKKVVRDSDRYCRNCGIRVLKPYQNILINITKVLLIIIFNNNDSNVYSIISNIKE